ncbi:hypothetical protein [Caulobacter henricii]|uniref:Uncharacterized protein n=1 Tax=Caulobacter henricii TaxID=69395 RepID=A0A0P0NZ83_9CAUL|nr:hypothetical protein [Caulobacter henricii]ALL13177.1 hypothetical protein AQ619_07315 [Caulobacter henricii]
MSRMDQTTADDVILDLIVEGVEPTHANLATAIAEYPQFREELEQFFATHSIQTALEAEPEAVGTTVKHFANIGVSRVLEHNFQARQASASQSAAQSKRLSRLIQDRGRDPDEVAVKVGLNPALLMKFDLHRIHGEVPVEVYDRLGLEAEVPPAYVIASATGPPIPSSRGNLRKAKGPIRIETETFEEAIRGSTLSDDLKAFWLGLIADKDHPKV